jgi:hypothetical protein
MGQFACGAHMEEKPTHSSRHYHIRWSRGNQLDRQRFATRQEAKAVAEELVWQEETYTIEEFDESCPVCGPRDE